MQGHIAEMKEIEHERVLKKKREAAKAKREKDLADPEKSSVHKRETDEIEIELTEVM
jgi:hypothetical protein